MGTNLLIYTVSCDNEFKQDSNLLKSRWKTDKLWREFKQNLINAIQKDDIEKIEHLLSKKSFLIQAHANILYEKKTPLVDLRGIELKNVNFSKIDMSYVCFDYATLTNVEFNETKLQYSSFNNAVIKKTKFINVQASPISASKLKLEDVEFDRGFFMHSDFKEASFLRCNKSVEDFELVNF